MSNASLPGPAIQLAQSSVTRAASGSWNVAWRVQNTGVNAVRLETVRLPHGQFKAAEQRFDPPVNLEPGGAAQFNTLVDCNEPAGLVTENAFAILAASWGGQKWRIFVRLRVVVDAAGKPQSAVELVTTQKVGFSGVPD